MKCFVAMAFGRTDADHLFDGLISLVLEKRGIAAIRVDRIEHNDNIDDRIIQEIRSANFAIADLTYSRPSVYYEAGFAEREIPVIYTVRRDHLGPSPNDEFGIFRVHFDLLMKNVIDWIDPADPLFAVRLARRVDEVLLPIHKRIQSDEEEHQERTALLALSHVDRVDRILKSCVNVLTLREFGASAITNQRRSNQRDFLRTSGSVLHYLAVRLLKSEESIPPTNVSQRFIIEDDPEYNLNFGNILKTLQELCEHYIICSFSSISFPHICEMLPSFQPGRNRSVLLAKKSQKVPSLTGEGLGDVHRAYGRTMFNGIGKIGTCVSNVPAGIPSTKPYQDHLFLPGSRVIACSMRSVPKTVSFQVIDNIDSVKSFEASLLKAVKAVF